MAKVNINYGCGCGFSTWDPSQAVAHCDASGHVMTVSGTIDPDSPNKTAKPRVSRTTPGKAVGVTTKVFKSPTDFENLRKKLGGGE